MVPAIYNFPDVWKGDTMPEVSFELKKSNTPIDLTDAVVRCNFKHKTLSNIYRYNSENGKIVVSTPPSDGTFIIAASVVDFIPGTYSYDLQVIYPDNTVRTYISGTLKVIQDITR